MTNDTTTLNGALQELGETMADNLVSMGVTGASASDGLTTLAGKILNIAPSVGGITPTVSITITTPTSPGVGDNVILSATVNADYDDTSLTDVDLKGYLQGATLTWKEGNTTLGTSVSDANGVATYTINNITSGTHTYTAIFDGTGTDYESATGTISITPTSYIVDISGMTDQSSEFGTILNFRSTGSSGTGSISYDSTNHYYVLADSSIGQEKFIPLNALTGLNNFRLEFEAQVVTTHLCGFGEFVGITNTNCSVFIGTDTGHFKKHQGSDTNITTGANNSTWYKFSVTVDSSGYYVTITDLNDNVKVNNYRCTISNSSTTKYGFVWGWSGTSQRFYLRNIKAEYV